MDATRSESRATRLPRGRAGFLGAQRAAAARASRRHAAGGRPRRRRRRCARRRRREAWTSASAYRRRPGHAGVDAVVVATPHADHDERGPPRPRGGQARPLREAADDPARRGRELGPSGRRAAAPAGDRLEPPVLSARPRRPGLVASWAIGRVESVRPRSATRASPEFLSGWHADRAVSGGGTLMDNGPHACDLVRRFLGEVVAAKGYTRERSACPGIESEAFAPVPQPRPRGRRGAVELDLEAGYLTIEVRGSEGFLRVETAPWRLSGVLSDGTRIDRRYLADRFGRGCSAADSAASGRSSASWRRSPTAILGTSRGGDRLGRRRATEMIDAVYRSAANGAEVDARPPPARTGQPRCGLSASHASHERPADPHLSRARPIRERHLDLTVLVRRDACRPPCRGFRCVDLPGLDRRGPARRRTRVRRHVRRRPGLPQDRGGVACPASVLGHGIPRHRPDGWRQRLAGAAGRYSAVEAARLVRPSRPDDGRIPVRCVIPSPIPIWASASRTRPSARYSNRARKSRSNSG